MMKKDCRGESVGEAQKYTKKHGAFKYCRVYDNWKKNGRRPFGGDGRV